MRQNSQHCNKFKNCIRSLLFLVIIALMPLVSGCPMIAGTVDSVRRVGLTSGSRESLLSPAVTKFKDALGWNDISLALSMATDQYRGELRDQLMKDKDKVKIIESTVDLIEFEDSAWAATVFMSTKAYTVPFYIAETTKQKQHWEFTLSGGWKIANKEAYKN